MGFVLIQMSFLLNVNEVHFEQWINLGLEFFITQINNSEYYKRIPVFSTGSTNPVTKFGRRFHPS